MNNPQLKISPVYCTVDAARLARVLKTILPALKGTSRPCFGGIDVRPFEDSVRLIGTNGHMFAVSKLDSLSSHNGDLSAAVGYTGPTQVMTDDIKTLQTALVKAARVVIRWTGTDIEFGIDDRNTLTFAPRQYIADDMIERVLQAAPLGSRIDREICIPARHLKSALSVVTKLDGEVEIRFYEEQEDSSLPDMIILKHELGTWMNTMIPYKVNKPKPEDNTEEQS